MPTRELVSRDLNRFALADGPFEYVLVRRRGRRGVGLKVDETGLTVSAPSTMPLSRIEAVMRESERWILRKIKEWSARQVPVVDWAEGLALPFLGEALTLRFAGGRPRVERAGTELHVAARSFDAETVKRGVVRWYKRAAHEHLGERVVALAQAARLAAPRVFISPALARWGSCNSRREVRLAWRLVKARPDLIDYVICHELAHLRHMNHSSVFWAEVARQCPDFRRLRDELYATDHLYRSF